MCMCGFQFNLLFFFHNHGKSILVAVMAVFQGSYIFVTPVFKSVRTYSFYNLVEFPPFGSTRH